MPHAGLLEFLMNHQNVASLKTPASSERKASHPQFL